MQYCVYTPPRSLLHDYPGFVTALFSGSYTIYNMLIDHFILYHVFSKQENCPFRKKNNYLNIFIKYTDFNCKMQVS